MESQSQWHSVAVNLKENKKGTHHFPHIVWRPLLSAGVEYDSLFAPFLSIHTERNVELLVMPGAILAKAKVFPLPMNTKTLKKKTFHRDPDQPCPRCLDWS